MKACLATIAKSVLVGQSRFWYRTLDKVKPFMSLLLHSEEAWQPTTSAVLGPGVGSRNDAGRNP